MKYTVKYTNPNNITYRVYTAEFDSKRLMNMFLRKNRNYPGSFCLLEIVKETARGEITVTYF